MSLKKYFKSLKKRRFALGATLKAFRFEMFLKYALRVAPNGIFVN